MRTLMLAVLAFPLFLLGGCADLITEHPSGSSVTELANLSETPLHVVIQTEHPEPGSYDLQTMDIAPGDQVRVEFYQMHAVHPPQATVSVTVPDGALTAAPAVTQLTLAPPRPSLQEAIENPARFDLGVDELGHVWYTPVDDAGTPLAAPRGRELVRVEPLELTLTPSHARLSALCTNLTDRDQCISRTALIRSVESAELIGPAGERCRLRLRSPSDTPNPDRLIIPAGRHQNVEVEVDWALPVWLDTAPDVEMSLAHDLDCTEPDADSGAAHSRLEWSGKVPIHRTEASAQRDAG